jgi:serine/threonine protein kinase
MTDFTGQVIERYEIQARLGEGGMAVVYKAVDTRLIREVAIKFIRADLFGPTVMVQLRARFLREAQALARLHHPNIVTVFDYGEFQDVPYLVMNYLPGGTLAGRMGKAMAPAEAVNLILPIARGLAHAHARDILHRDVKPTNILFDADGQPQLSDFGIARMLDNPGGTTLTGTGAAIGTPAYMAPEQWRNEVSPSSDQYALGVILFEMLSGHLPYEADTPGGYFEKQLTQPLPLITIFAPHTPAGLTTVINRALALTPAPQIPPEIEAQFTSRALPDPDAIFSPLQFTQRLDQNLSPVAPSASFTNPLEVLYAWFTYDHMSTAPQWTAIWLREGELVFYETSPWQGGTGGMGYTRWEPSPEEWLPGQYEVQIFIGLEFKVSGRFTLTGDAPTPQPSSTPTATLTHTPLPTATRTKKPTPSPTLSGPLLEVGQITVDLYPGETEIVVGKHYGFSVDLTLKTTFTGGNTWVFTGPCPPESTAYYPSTYTAGSITGTGYDVYIGCAGAYRVTFTFIADLPGSPFVRTFDFTVVDPTPTPTP